MHAEYEATIDEIADAALRSHSRSRLARRWYWQQVVWTGFSAGLILFILIPEPYTVRLLYAVIGATIGAVGLALTYRRSQMKRLRKYFREQFHGDGPLHFSVDLQPDCIAAEQGGTRFIHKWETVLEVVDSGDAIEFRIRNGGFLLVRNRGFSSEGDRTQFLAEARKLAADAGSRRA